MRLEQKASQQIRNVKAAFKRILLLAERVKNMNGNIELAISIVFTLFTGGLMMLVYRFCHDALTYNRRFNITLLMLAFVSTILLPKKFQWTMPRRQIPNLWGLLYWFEFCK